MAGSILKGIDICRTTISAIHKTPHETSFVIRDPNHVLHFRALQRYGAIMRGTIDREKEGLWLIVGSNPMPRTRVVRSWAKRRVYRAITEQLRANGFDIKGRKVEGAGNQMSHGGHCVESLIGTVNVMVLEKSIHHKYEVLLRQAGLLVQAIVERCEQRKKSSRMNSGRG